MCRFGQVDGSARNQREFIGHRNLHGQSAGSRTQHGTRQGVPYKKSIPDIKYQKRLHPMRTLRLSANITAMLGIVSLIWLVLDYQP